MHPDAPTDFGLMVGFDRTRPHGVIQDDSGKDIPVSFHPSHLAILHTSPRQLIVKVHTPALKCLVMAGHAPHSGASHEDVETWWKEFSSHVPPLYTSQRQLQIGLLPLRVCGYLAT